MASEGLETARNLWHALKAAGQLRKLTPAARAELLLSLDPRAVLHGDDFAIVAVPVGGCAIVDLRSPLLMWGAFSMTLEEVRHALAQPGAVDAFRAFIAEQRQILPSA